MPCIRESETCRNVAQLERFYFPSQNSRRGCFQRVFPSMSSNKYLRFFESQVRIILRTNSYYYLIKVRAVPACCRSPSRDQKKSKKKRKILARRADFCSRYYLQCVPLSEVRAVLQPFSFNHCFFFPEWCDGLQQFCSLLK